MLHQDKKPTLEDLLTKFVTNSENRFQQTETTLRNQQASIQDLARQLCHISKKLDERPQERLSSDTETNLKEQCHTVFVQPMQEESSHAIFTRSGKEYPEAQPAKSDVVISSDADTEDPEQPVKRREEKEIEKTTSVLREY